MRIVAYYKIKLNLKPTNAFDAKCKQNVFENRIFYAMQKFFALNMETHTVKNKTANWLF